jgi:Tol biopolymer transport system component
MVSGKQMPCTAKIANNTEGLFMKKILLGLSFLCLASILYAQDVPFEKSAFPDKKKELRVAKGQLKKGMKLAGKGEIERKEAMDFLLSAYAFNPNNAKLNFTIGEILFKGSDPHLSLPYLEKAYSLNQKVNPEIYFLLGRSYHLNHYFELAVSFYQEYSRSLKTSKGKKMLPVLNQYIRQASFGDSLVKASSSIYVENLGDKINTVWPDYAPVLSPDGRFLWFTSKRPGSTGGLVDRNDMFFEDIYVLERTGGSWTEPVSLKPPVNTEKHESSAGLSAGRKSLIIRRGNPTGDFYEMIGNNPPAIQLLKLSKRINSSSDETTITFSPDSSRVWFVSSRRKGYGGKDIWMCQAKRKGGWKKAMNAGPMINTAEDEESPFMALDGKSFYFSSKGLAGMGGYDIFKTTYENGAYSGPVNMGYPINSASDDIFFSIDTKGKNGFIASSRPGGSGSYDLYKVRLGSGEKQVLFQTDTAGITLSLPAPATLTPLPALKPYEPVILIKGTVTDAARNIPVSARITLTELNSGSIAESVTTSASGNFLMNVPFRNKYTLLAQAKGYMPKTETADVSLMDSYSTVLIPVTMSPVLPGANLELKNTPFVQGESRFSDVKMSELDLVADFLKTNETVLILIKGFAAEGEDKTLAGTRATAVAEYLYSKGIFSGRITAEKYSVSPETGVVTPEPENSFVRIVITAI